MFNLQVPIFWAGSKNLIVKTPSTHHFQNLFPSPPQPYPYQHICERGQA